MIKTRAVSWVLLIAAIALSALAPLWEELSAWIRLAMYLALAGVGPVLVWLDSVHPCYDKRWKHIVHTAVHLAAFGGLVLHLSLNAMEHERASLDMAFVGALLLLTYSVVFNRSTVLLYVEKGSLLAHPNAKFVGFLVGLLYFVPLFVPMLLPWFTALTVALLAYWRRNLWHYAATALSHGQHQEIWPRLAKKETPFDFWLHLYGYSMNFPDIDKALSMLSLNQLIKLMSFHLQVLKRQVVNRTVTGDLTMSIKKAINEKEPRAIPLWEFFDDMHVLHQIERLDSKEANDDASELELPDL